MKPFIRFLFACASLSVAAVSPRALARGADQAVSLGQADAIGAVNPCGKFGKQVSLALGLATGLDSMDNSFAPDTLVHVRPQGASSLDAMRGKSEKKAIKDLKPGDEVLAFAEWQDPGQAQTDSGDKLDQRLSYQKVSDMVTSTREQRVVHLTLDDGQTIEATDGHPFKTTDGWRDVILLKKGGMLLLKGSGEPAPSPTFALKSRLFPSSTSRLPTRIPSLSGWRGCWCITGEAQSRRRLVGRHPTTLMENLYPDLAAGTTNSGLSSSAGVGRTKEEMFGSRRHMEVLMPHIGIVNTRTKHIRQLIPRIPRDGADNYA